VAAAPVSGRSGAGADVELSVVVVTYGLAGPALDALAAVERHTTLGHEVIVVDNASPGSTADELAGALGPRIDLVRNPTNVGFGPAVNQAVARASGRWVAVLNPDTVVSVGWAEALVGELVASPAVAAAVPTLRFADGSLQEAGPTVYREGSTYAFGCAEPPDRPEHFFRRAVPYASAACMVVRRTAFTAVGGFADAYAPAYFEDVDLCFAFAERGWSVVYRPDVVVEHLRGASSEPGRVQELLERNAAVLRARWPERLAVLPSYERLPEHPHRIVGARDLDCAERALVIGRTAGVVGAAASGRAAFALAPAPDRRVTLLVLDGVDGALVAEWSHAGFEVSPGPPPAGGWDRWLEQRRFHYDVVVEVEPAPELADALRRTQARAQRGSMG
jgi:O-antigen biosynthesis protein